MLLFFFSSDQGVNSLVITTSQGPFGIASSCLLEVGVFSTIVDSLAVEVMSVEVILGFVVKKLHDQKLSMANHLFQKK